MRYFLQLFLDNVGRKLCERLVSRASDTTCNSIRIKTNFSYVSGLGMLLNRLPKAVTADIMYNSKVIDIHTVIHIAVLDFSDRAW
jgi:hypothetical protein